MPGRFIALCGMVVFFAIFANTTSTSAPLSANACTTHTHPTREVTLAEVAAEKAVLKAAQDAEASKKKQKKAEKQRAKNDPDFDEVPDSFDPQVVYTNVVYKNVVHAEMQKCSALLCVML